LDDDELEGSETFRVVLVDLAVIGTVANASSSVVLGGRVLESTGVTGQLKTTASPEYKLFGHTQVTKQQPKIGAKGDVLVTLIDPEDGSLHVFIPALSNHQHIRIIDYRCEDVQVRNLRLKGDITGVR
jgi:hypothetical protein